MVCGGLAVLVVVVAAYQVLLLLTISSSSLLHVHVTFWLLLIKHRSCMYLVLSFSLCTMWLLVSLLALQALLFVLLLLLWQVACWQSFPLHAFTVSTGVQHTHISAQSSGGRKALIRP